MKDRLRKFGASMMLALTFFVFSSAALFAPKTALATPSEVILDLPAIVNWIKEALVYLGQTALVASVSTAMINTVTYATDRLAYDAAVYIAAGGNAEDPLFENRTAGEYFADYGASVAGEALGAIDDTGILGNFSLCEPNVSGVTLAFKFGIQSAFDRPEPECKWSEVQGNWDGFLTDIETMATDPFGKNSLITAKLADMYNPKSSDLSVGIQMYTDVLNKAQTDAANNTLREMFGGFFKSKTNFITGRVETPAEVVQKRLDAKLEASDSVRNQIAVQALGDKDVLLQIAKHAGSVFTNTLLSKVTEKLYDGLFSGLDQTTIDPFNSGGLGTSNGEDARQSFRSFLTATPLSVENYSQLQEFSACPSAGKTLYNCVADSSLVTAVSRADSGSSLTVAEAIEEGLLNSSWPLIPSSDAARDQDPFCYTYGYCHGNLVKLRKARIISTGWELAAESNANTENSPVTLGEAVDAFNDCNDQGELDDNHPWCHLIDPNWVLKYPETQCKALVYGEQLFTSVSDERQQVCVDMPSCIDEDGDGNCTGGYGYCVREENVWRFRGEECPDYYASCTTYEDPNGESFDFLSNTTNSDNCTVDSVGCLWYATQKEDDGTGVFDFPDYTSETGAANFAAAEAADDIYKNRIYFTSEVADCVADDAGCKELVSRADGVTLNMVNNPSFEDDVDEDGIPDGWITSGTGGTYSTDATTMLGGTDAVNPGTAGAYEQWGIVLSQSAEYTLSFYASQGAGSATTAVTLELASSDAAAVDFGGFAVDGDCSAATDTLTVAQAPTDTNYQRYTCTFTVPTMTDAAAEITATLSIAGGDLNFDEVQLEQESSASSYHEGYSDAALDLTYVKVAPAYLGCTGDSATDAEDCADYATMCSETDVGCSLYTPSNGDPSVAGIADDLDVCPESCVGYDTFKQEATRYEPDGDFPVYFIPDSAEECSAQAVGCDEFTDISTETASYFTDLRACLTTDQADLNTVGADQAAVFYTWEGSDTEGFQLKTWNLLESQMTATSYAYEALTGTDDAPGSAPCTNWSATATGIECNDDESTRNELESDSEDCDEHDDTITNPDCREFYDASGIIHYRSWSKTVTVSDSCVTYRKTDIVGASATTQESNCEDSGGFYNSSTAECRYYGYADESTTCSEKQSGCRDYTGGRSRNSRQALTEYFEDGDLTNWDAASATDVTLSNESIATDGHSLSSDGESVWTYVGGSTTACTETVSGEGCASATGALGGTCTIENGEYYCGTLNEDLFADKTYTISFWAKGTGTLMVGFDTALSGTGAVDASFFATAITLDTDWNEYSYGPLDMNSTDYPSFGGGSSALVFTPSSGGTFYIDNVVLREGEDNITVIKDSWVTPAECDETAEGTSSPQYMLGCQEYTDQNGDVSNLKSFNSLCDESQVGCSAYFLTQESDATSAAIYGGYCNTISGAEAPEATSCYYTVSGGTFDTTSQYLCTIGVGTTSCEFNLDWYVPAANLPSHLSYAASTVVSPADKDVFLVVNDDVECTSDVAGCMEVGLPVFNQDHTAVASWTATYLMNTPADYESTLCSEKELFCSAWVDKDSSTSYFKNPQDQTCEYRTDVTIDNVRYSGWFKTDEDELCATDSAGEPQYVIGGDTSGIWKNGDTDYNNWVGTCLTKYDSCSEFQDLTDLPTDEVYGDADGTSYFYLNNDSLEDNSLPDSQKCNGQVSQKEGCGLFNDTSEPSKTYNMSASYVASKHADTLFGGAPNGMADPVDCEESSTTIDTPSGDSVDLCANRCWYDAEAYYDINGTTETYIYDGSCYDDSDCRPLTSESNESITGFCASAYDADGDGDDDAAPRLENDANIVLKVNRDRECSEWLSCSDAQTTWDERTNSYKTICGDIGLCTEYSTAGNASFCSAWKNDGPAIALDIDTYSERDVSWYGDDYSGYAIPGSLPVDQLTQKNVAPPGYCEGSLPTTLGLLGDACTDDADCGGTAGDYTYCIQTDESDYRLAYVAGECTGDYGDSCSIGYCENTGSPCSTTDSCGTEGGSCLMGTCYDVSTTLCASSADCSTGDVCSGGYCATEGAAVVLDDYFELHNMAASFEDIQLELCGSAGTLNTSVNYKVGTCMRDECVLTPNGSTFDVSTAEAKSCRGYPEINSPFPNSVVTAWQDPSTLASVSTDAELTISNDDSVPVSFVQNFEGARNCAFGHDCECSYKKVGYGENGLNLRYFDADFDSAEIESSDGVCSGGDYKGSDCSAATAETICGTGIACDLVTKIDDVLGMEGYCLERDSSTNILGDRDLNACLTWLPVDQLAGSTDLYAKYMSAGFDGEAFYCGEAHIYYNVDSILGCAEIRGSDGRSLGPVEADSSNNDYCRLTMECPEGFFAVGGPAEIDHTGYSDYTYQDYCTHSYSGAGGVNACPYQCVPKNSIHDNGTLCEEPTAESEIDVDFGYSSPFSSTYTSTEVYYASNGDDTTELLGFYSDCTYSGASAVYDASELGTIAFPYQMSGDADIDTDMAYHLFDFDDDDGTADLVGDMDWQFHYVSSYPACTSLLEVSDQNPLNYNYAWTDRIANALTDYTVSVGDYAYNYDTATAPFGRSLSPIEAAAGPDTNGDPAPAILPACGIETGTTTANPPESVETPDQCVSDSGTGYGPLFGSDATPQARQYIDWSSTTVPWTYGGGTGNLDTTEDRSHIAGRLDQLFAKPLASWRWSSDYDLTVGGPVLGLYEEETTPASSFDWDVRVEEGNPPSVWAVDMDNCYNDECEEDQSHGLTVNDQNEGDVSSDEFYRAYLKFYAAADKNQLPLRRIIVDWGDDNQSGSDSSDNFYKNHRGLQSGGETSICDTEPGTEGYEWGMNADSCDSNYFSYNHIYTCNPAGFADCADTDDDGIYDNSPCTTDGISCTFRPRVHILDNWGFCAGTCDSTLTTTNDDDTASCFDSGTTWGNTEAANECDYTSYPSEDYTGATDPWVYYDGTITVTP